MSLRLHGLVAATHTPFHADGSLNLAVVEKQAAHLLANRVRWAFIGGTTGESHSLTLAERLALGERWSQVTRGSDLRVVVHVGANALRDAAELAAAAARNGAAAVSALTPSYFKPRSVGLLVDCCAEIAAASPDLPFYFYDIPSLTGVNLSMPDFLVQARDRIPNLAGLKFTNPDLMTYQLCVNADEGRWDVPWGIDEALLGALVLGARGAVGSSYNFAAPVYHRILDAYARGDLVTARAEQFRSVRVIQAVAARGYMGAAKAVMGMLGVPVGPARLPQGNPSPEELTVLRGELEALGVLAA